MQRKLVVEFIGTFFFILTVGLAIANAGDLAPLAIGSSLMVMVYAGGHVSGGHYNPAVSLAVFMRGKMTQPEMIAYWIAQFAAALAAALVVILLDYNPADPTQVAGAGKALTVEFLFTFALAYVVLNAATTKGTEGNSFYGLAIGFTVVIAVYAAGAISGGAFNPAIGLGIVVMGIVEAKEIWIYLVGGFAGGAAAAIVFLFTQPGEKVTGDTRAAEPRSGRPDPERRAPSRG